MDFSGKNFCISGLIGEEEKLLKSAIEKRGGIVRSSVVKDLDYLIYHYLNHDTKSSQNQLVHTCSWNY